MADATKSASHGKQGGNQNARTTRRKAQAQETFSLSAVVVVGGLCLAHAAQRFLVTSITHGVQPDEVKRRLEESSSNAGVWVGMVGMAMVMKLAGSIDDIAWLLPFLSGGSSIQRLRFGAFYIFNVQLVVGLAVGVSTGGKELLGLFIPDDPNWPLSKILEFMSAILLTLYSLKLFREWWLERHSSDDEAAPATDNHDGSRRTSNEGTTMSPVVPAGGQVVGKSEVASAEKTCAQSESTTTATTTAPAQSESSTRSQQRAATGQQSHGQSHWEVVRDAASQRWYFQDRLAGVASWERPPNCHVEIPSAPPTPSIRMPTGLPHGWSAAWDSTTERYYYYNAEKMLRTWEHPNATGMDEAAQEDAASDVSCPVPSVWQGEQRSTGGPVMWQGGAPSTWEGAGAQAGSGMWQGGAPPGPEPLSLDQVRLDHLVQGHGMQRTFNSPGTHSAPPPGTDTAEVLSMDFPHGCAKLGVRVRPGPDWEWGEQDEAGCGRTIAGSTSSGWIRVEWASGASQDYRVGAEGKFDLFIAGEVTLDELLAQKSAAIARDDFVTAQKLKEQIESFQSQGSHTRDLQEELPAEKRTLGRLFTIAMFGSLDDFAVFVSLLLSGVLSAPQLVIGVFIATILVVILCVGIGKLACVVRLVEMIPLWCIIGSFAIWTYISTFVMD